MFDDKIISWYKKNQRDLPWRNTKNPYFIWLSEIILQQTRVIQGLPYYFNFVEKYPTIQELAAANEDDVLRIWQGLGYYSRARNLHHTAKIIAQDHNGVFPNSFISLKNLKGIGNYTAAAIASFAFDEIVPAVDGNVIRVLSRYFEYKDPVDSTIGQKKLFEIAKGIISKKNPADFNQGMMELGATICSPKQPKCSICPIEEGCLARKNSSYSSLPLKLNKIKVTTRYLNYLVFVHSGKIWMKQRKKTRNMG
jgi:A/G-specific adenine glycosylase